MCNVCFIVLFLFQICRDFDQQVFMYRNPVFTQPVQYVFQPCQNDEVIFYSITDCSVCSLEGYEYTAGNYLEYILSGVN